MIVNLILGAVIVIQSIIHFIERRDMANRLMCKDAKEYSNVFPPKDIKHTPIPSAHKRTLDKWKKSFKAGE